MGDVLVLHLQLDFPRQGGSQRTDFSLHHHLTIIFFFCLSLIYSFKTSKQAVSVSFRSDDDDDDQTREGRRRLQPCR